MTYRQIIYSWIARRPYLQSPFFLCFSLLSFALVCWVPEVVDVTTRHCSHTEINFIIHLNTIIITVSGMVLGFLLVGKFDTACVKRELISVAVLAIVFMVMKDLTNVVDGQLAKMVIAGKASKWFRIETSTMVDHDTDHDTEHDTGHDTEHDTEHDTFFSYQYNVALTVIMLILIVVVSVLDTIRRTIVLSRKEKATKPLNDRDVLTKILGDPQKKRRFKEFLEHEFSVENVLFYDTVVAVVADAEKKITAKSIVKWRQTLLSIYDEFVSDTGLNQVNLPSDLHKSLASHMRVLETILEDDYKSIASCIKELKAATDSVFTLMATDSLPRYLAAVAVEITKRESSKAPRHVSMQFKKTTSMVTVPEAGDERV